MSVPVLELKDVSKDYQGLRPLRISSLSISSGEQVALVGLDQVSAEVFVNLVTGATLPDRGEIRLFGRATSEIVDSDDWLASVDKFGIVSRRAVLLDALTVVQNLAMPFTLEVEPPSAEMRARAIALAREVGLPESSFDRPVSGLDSLGVFRVRLARAIALDPSILVFEHPTADVAPSDVAELASRCRDVAAGRNIATVVLTADRDFAAASSSRALVHDPASGRLTAGGWLSRFLRA